MRFSVLGRLEVIGDDGAALDIPQPRQRALLAVLLLHANRELSVGRLAQSLGDQDESSVSPGALRTQVWTLRKLLAPAQRLHTGQYRGYRLEVRPGELDAAQFRELAGQGREALESGDQQAAASHLTEALARWGEPALADVPATLELAPLTQRLLDERDAARQLLTEARLGLGQHADLIPELREGTAADPANERLWEQLMRALHAAGRTADALAVYQQARTALQAEFGLEPGQRLQELHGRLLAGDPATAGPAAGPGVVPRQLPAAARPFVGREPELAQLDRLLDRADAPTAVVISAIGGTAGVGKTALAVHWAHRIAERFPDGQLYMNLRGFGPDDAQVAAEQATRSFLDALDVPADRIPADPGTWAGLYRSLLAGKRVLIVLDNARDADQVRPLLPGSPGCAVVVTSRNQLVGLAAGDGAHLLTLDVLADGEARELLAGRLGAARMAAEPQASAELVRLCARLPLALAIAAARAAARPAFPLAALAAELRDEGPLDALETGEPTASIRAVFSWSGRQLSTPAARMFGLLGIHPGPDVTVPAAASLAGVTVGAARRVLGELARASLLTEHVPGRFAFHDLLRAYAGEHATTSGGDAERRDATRRLLDYYLHAAVAADRLLQPTREPLDLPRPADGVLLEVPASYGEALTWFEAEHAVLLASVRLAASLEFSALAWQLAWSLFTFLYRRSYWPDLAAVQHVALAAARQADDQRGQAHAHRNLGRAYSRLGSYPEAHQHLRDAFELYRETGDRASQARTSIDIATMLEGQGQLGPALGYSRWALDLFRAAGHRSGQADALNGVGWYRAQLGNYRQALASCEQALVLQRELDDQPGAAASLDSLGYIHHHLGHYQQAIGCYQQAEEQLVKLGDRYNRAGVLDHLGDSQHAAGDLRAARQTWARALSILVDLQLDQAAEVRAKLARPDELPGRINCRLTGS